MLRESLAALTAAIVVLFVVPAQAVTLGQSEDFQSGVGYWSGGSWVSTGGPAGEGDAYFATDFGISVWNRLWGGDYLAAGVNAIEADLINLGELELNIRFHFIGYGGQYESSSPCLLLPGLGWQHVRFGLSAGDLTPDSQQALLAVGTIDFSDRTAVVGAFGIDNIQLTPEPASLSLLLGASILMVRRQPARRR